MQAVKQQEQVGFPCYSVGHYVEKQGPEFLAGKQTIHFVNYFNGKCSAQMRNSAGRILSFV